MPEITSAKARLLAKRLDHAMSGQAYERHAEQLRSAGKADQMAPALLSAATQFEQAGEMSRAADLYYRAARSYYGQHDNLAALGCVQAAMKAAESAQDVKLRDQIAALFQQIKKSVEPAGASH
jgi:tetratricopeptide (TPR) repeat protein